MFFTDFLSYKTFYYFLYDDSCLDLSLFKDVTKYEHNFTKKNGYTAQNFASLYQDIKTGTKDLVVIKTSKGSVVFHKFDDHEYVKDFLKQNSKNKPCGIFGSHRVGDVYQIGIAENGEIKRYIFSDEEDQILEGEKTEYEKNVGKDYKLDDEGFFVDFLDEDDVYEYAKDFLPFSVENDDVEVLDFKYYKFTGLSSYIEDDVIDKIHKNLKQQSIEDVSLSLMYFPKIKESYLLGVHKDNGEYYHFFAEEIFDLKDKNEINQVFNRCLNSCVSSKFLDCKKPNGVMIYYSSLINKYKYNCVSFMVDNEDVGMLSCAWTMRKNKKLKVLEIDKRIMNINDYKDEKFGLVYDYIQKYIY